MRSLEDVDDDDEEVVVEVVVEVVAEATADAQESLKGGLELYVEPWSLVKASV